MSHSKTSNDQMYSFPRDYSVAWHHGYIPPPLLKPPRTSHALSLWGVQGNALNRSHIVRRDASLSDSGYIFFNSEIALPLPPLRKILQRKRHFEANHGIPVNWNVSTGILTRIVRYPRQNTCLNVSLYWHPNDSL